MKKTLKKFLSATFATTLCLSACASFVACNSSVQGGTPMADKTPQGYVSSTLFSFESVAELETFGSFGELGKIALNQDKNYVTDGSASLKVEVHGGRAVGMPYIGDWKPCLMLYTIENGFTEHLKDYSRTKCFAVDVFNASDRDTSISLFLDPESGAFSSIYLKEQVALKGKKTTLVFETNLERNANCGIGALKDIQINFTPVVEGQTPLTLYLDNFRAVDYADENYEVPQAAMPTVNEAEGEICYFESEYFVNNLGLRHTELAVIPPNMFPKLSVNTDEFFVSEGKTSMRISRPSTVASTKEWRCGAYVDFPSRYVSSIHFEKYDKNTTSIRMDVYNDYDYAFDFVLQFVDKIGYVEHVLTLKPNSWNEVEIPMNKVTEGTSGLQLDWSSVQEMRFLLQEYYGTGEADIYVDNLRFVGGA